jgi:thioredoxin reductase (NADPH)
MSQTRPDREIPFDSVAELVLYVRHGCHLCDQFLVDLSLELGTAIERVQVVDVDSDADLATRYGLRVPVLAAGGEPICEAVLDPARLRDALGL